MFMFIIVFFGILFLVVVGATVVVGAFNAFFQGVFGSDDKGSDKG